MNADVIPLRTRLSRQEEARRAAVMAAMPDVARKLREHRTRGYGHIAVGAFDELLAAWDAQGGVS